MPLIIRFIKATSRPTSKGLGHATINKPVISIVYIVADMCQLSSAQILVDGVNPQ